MRDLRTKYIAMAVCGRLMIACGISFGWHASGFAQETDPRAGGDAPSAVAATVGDISILVAEIDLRVKQALGERSATEQAHALLKAEALEQLIEQQKVLVQLQRRGEACTEKELDVEIHRLEEDLIRQEKTLDDYCESLGLSLVSLRRMLQWQLSWKRCCQNYLTDKNLQQYFERHQKQFDGTTMRVAQLLLKPNTDSDREDLIRRAREIRRDIVAGKMTFADAAQEYSQSPSGRDNGQLGWISRRAPMPESFSRAAYQLHAGEISEPVETAFGVHLIHCLEINAGQKTWQEVRPPLNSAVSEYLFHWLADRPEPRHVVRYTGNVPYFKPGTRQLAEEQ